jgi:hypothetical protein
MDDSDNASLYIVSIKNGRASVVVEVVNW